MIPECHRDMRKYTVQGPRLLQRAISTTPKGIKLEGLEVCVGYADFLSVTLPFNIRHFDKFVVVTSSDDRSTQEIARKHGAHLVVSDRHHEDGADFNKGKLINDGLAALSKDGWILLTDADIFLQPNLRACITKHATNYETLYYSARVEPRYEEREAWVRQFLQDPNLMYTLEMQDPNKNCKPWGYFQLFSKRAKAIHKRGQHIYSEDFRTAGSVDNHFQNLWAKQHKEFLPLSCCVHIPHGSFTTNWAGRVSTEFRLSSDPVTIVRVNKNGKSGWTTAGWVCGTRYRPVNNIPGNCWVQLQRADTGEYVILRVGAGHKGRTGLVLGTYGRGVLHAGVFTSNTELADEADLAILYTKGARSWTGWGVGHSRSTPGIQAFVWDGKPIARTEFDISFKKAELTEEEKQHVVFFNRRR